MASKYREIADSLRSDIQAAVYPPGSMLPTEAQLCQTFNASRQTVRQALSILCTEGLIARRQGSGSRVLDPSNVTPHPKRTVAIITTYISEYIFPSILRHCEEVLSANNCTPMLFATSNQVAVERRVLTGLLQERHLDGILVEGTQTTLPNTNLALYQKLVEKHIPLVFIHGSYDAIPQAVCITDDNFSGGKQLVDYLVSKGHTRIAGVFKVDDTQGHQRYAGFAAGLQAHNLPLEDASIAWYNTRDKEGFGSDSSLWEERFRPVLAHNTAVVCYNDEVASYIVKNLVKDRVRIPEEMAVVSFDNSTYSTLSSVPITSLSHGDNNLGGIAAETLVRLLNGEKVESRAVPWILVEKESS